MVALLRETRELVRTFAVLFDEVTSQWDPRIAESEGWCPGGGYIASGINGTICSGGGFLGGCLDTLDGMVGYRWIEFGGRVEGVRAVVFGIKIRSVDVVECVFVGKIKIRILFGSI